MSYSILSGEARQNLEQERARLVKERETIVASVTAELDRLIHQLDILLGQESVEVASPKSSTRKASSTTKAEALAIAEEEAPAPEPTNKRMKPKAKAQVKARKGKSFDAKQIKRSFKGMTTNEAIVQIMEQAPGKKFETDELIEALYEPFDVSEMGRARKSVSAVLLHGLRAGKFEKVEENPARYQLK